MVEIQRVVEVNVRFQALGEADQILAVFQM